MALGDKALVQAVLDDWQTAPVPEALRATLGFLKKLTLAPDQIVRADVDAQLPAPPRPDLG